MQKRHLQSSCMQHLQLVNISGKKTTKDCIFSDDIIFKKKNMFLAWIFAKGWR